MPVWLQRLIILGATAALLAACAPIAREGANTAPGSTVPRAAALSVTLPTPTPEATATASPATAALPTATASPTPDDRAMATVITGSLRVRQEPSIYSRLLGKIVNGESYPVTGRSSDGMWLELELPQLESGSGWVTVDLVTMRGDITDLRIVQAPTPPPPTATFTPAPATATPEGGAVITETLTTTATVEPAAEPVAEPAAESAPEPTVEPTVPVMETTSVTETAAVTESVPMTATAPLTAPAAGFATINADWRVRIRAEPNTDAPIVGFGYRGETFPVLELSDDGLWVRLGGSPTTPENSAGGWTSAQFLVMGQ